MLKVRCKSNDIKTYLTPTTNSSHEMPITSSSKLQSKQLNRYTTITKAQLDQTMYHLKLNKSLMRPKYEPLETVFQQSCLLLSNIEG